jgi:hypothetical protein
MTGEFVRGLPGEGPLSVFRYGVLRVWRLPVGPLLEGGLGTLPLAPISAVAEADLRPVIKRMKERLRRQERERELWTATKILLRLRYPPDLVDLLLRGVMGMRESSTYQAILAEGERNLLLAAGEGKFGPLDDSTRAAIAAIADVARLEELAKRLFQANSWEELLGPRGRRRNGRRKPGR